MSMVPSIIVTMVVVFALVIAAMACAVLALVTVLASRERRDLYKLIKSKDASEYMALKETEMSRRENKIRARGNQDDEDDSPPEIPYDVQLANSQTAEQAAADFEMIMR